MPIQRSRRPGHGGRAEDTTLTISGSVEDVIGGLSPANFLSTALLVEGTFEAIWKGEADFKAAFTDPTPQAMRIDLKNTT